jgi:hypothetical protein
VPAYAGSYASLLPRAGPELTLDPLGLVLSAAAAGCAIAILVAGVLGAGPRMRLALGLVAAAVVLLVPAVTAMRVARASGIHRAAHPWAASVRGDTARPAREAWSASFRQDPPRELRASRGWPVAGPLLRPFLADPRVLPLLALAALGLLAARRGPAHRPLVAALVLLTPPMVTGTVFGSAAAILLLAMLLACRLAARGRPAAAIAGVLAGLGAALAFTSGPGIGIANFAAYFGRDGEWRPIAAAVAAAAFLPWMIANRAGLAGGRFAQAGAGLLGLLWVLPGTSPHDLAVPIALLGMAAMRDEATD